jgi:hypothetical protein
VPTRFAWLFVVGCGRISFDPLSDSSAPDAFAGPHGGAVSLDDTGYIEIDSVCPSLGSSFTIEGWFKPASTQLDVDAVAAIGINSNPATANYLQVMWDWRDGSFQYLDDVFTSRMQNPAAVAADQWHYFSVTYDAGHGVLYSDGVVFSDVQTPQTIISPCHVSLGQEFDMVGASDNMIGLIDEVSVWSIAKTQSEVIAAMNANPVGNEPNLIAYYPFDGDGVDRSGNGHTAVLLSSAIVPVP